MNSSTARAKADIEAFVTRWTGVTASEISTSQSFIIELCELLDVPRPHPTPERDYMFERPITFQNGDGSTSEVHSGLAMSTSVSTRSAACSVIAPT